MGKGSFSGAPSATPTDLNAEPSECSTALAPCATSLSSTAKIHHVTWYTTGNGNTDIDNLVPLCSRHHHLAHEGGWQLAITPDRTLTVTRPDNTIHSHAPPTAKAA